MKKVIAVVYMILAVSTAWSQKYYAYVTAESEDEVAVVEFDGENAKTIKRIPVGVWPAEIEGPHGITISPDGKYWYLSLAHGNPYGTVYKFTTGDDRVVGKVQLGLFPASMQISTATGFLYVVNFNLHGDMVPSSVSVVDPETMTELKQITTGVMPHGSRISPDGMYQYSVGMMSGELFEINTTTLSVSRILNLDMNKGVKPGMDKMSGMKMEMKHDMKGHEHHGMHHSKVKPTWVIPHPSKKSVYIAGNGADEILEVDLEQWSVVNRFSTGKGPYNVEVTPDGRYMVATYKSDALTGVWDLKKNKEVARIKNSRRVSHGIAISSDSRYAFVSVEGIGGEPGSVDVIDLKSLSLVSSTDLGKQAGGIAFWKIEE